MTKPKIPKEIPQPKPEIMPLPQPSKPKPIPQPAPKEPVPVGYFETTMSYLSNKTIYLDNTDRIDYIYKRIALPQYKK